MQTEAATGVLSNDATPSLIVHPHPLVGDGRIVETAAFLPRETLGRYMGRTGVAVPNGPVHVWHNGHPVSSELWDLLIPRTGDQIVIRARALGGGGGNKVLRTVAMIAVVAASIYAPYAAGLTKVVGGVEVLTAGGSLLSAGVMIGGTLMISPLYPEVTP